MVPWPSHSEGGGGRRKAKNRGAAERGADRRACKGGRVGVGVPRDAMNDVKAENACRPRPIE